jgi:DHA1 family multidrug resistance protein-like MFS transporter
VAADELNGRNQPPADGDDDFPDSARRRNLVATCLAAALASIGFLFVIPIFPLYTLSLLEDGSLAEAAAWSGLAIGISPLLSASTGPLWATLALRIGHKAMLMRSVASIGLATALMAFATHPIHLLGARVLIGLFGGIPVAAMAAITASSRRSELGRAIAALQTAQMLGPTVGPLLGGILATFFGLRASFLVAAGLFVAACVVAGWLYRNPPRISAEAARRREAPAVKPGGLLFWTPLASLFIANFVDGSFISLLPVVIGPLGAPPDMLTLMAGVGVSGAGMAVAIAANVAGRLESRMPVFKMIAVALGVTSLLVLMLAAIEVWWQFVVMRVLVAVAAGGVPTLAYGAVASQSSAAQRAKSVGIATSVGMLGWAASPYISGLMVGIGLHYYYVGVAVALAACAIASWRALQRVRTAPHAPPAPT